MNDYLHKKVRIVVGATILLLLWLLSGCKTCECLPSVEYRDSIVTRYQHDTIQTYEKDSVFILIKGDTVWREHWSIRYRDRVVVRHDTIYKDRQSEVVRTERVVPGYYRSVSWAFCVLVALLVVAAAVRILIRVYLKK